VPDSSWRRLCPFIRLDSNLRGICDRRIVSLLAGRVSSSDRSYVASADTREYYAFEQSFPSADAWIVLTAFAATPRFAQAAEFGAACSSLPGSASLYLCRHGCLTTYKRKRLPIAAGWPHGQRAERSLAIIRMRSSPGSGAFLLVCVTADLPPPAGKAYASSSWQHRARILRDFFDQRRGWHESRSGEGRAPRAFGTQVGGFRIIRWNPECDEFAW